MQKMKEKLREEFKNYDFIGCPDNPKTFREMAIREIYFEKKGMADPTSQKNVIEEI